MILIIYCHPYQRSFNHAELLAVEENLQRHHQPYQLLDLHADHFKPIYSTEELGLYHQGGTTDPLVKRYLRLLRQAQTVIMIAPIWWNSIPGMLKGFVDKVMKEGTGLSHTVTKWGIHGELANIKHCYLLTTSTSPTFYLRYFCGNAVQKIFLNTTLKQLGVQDRHWQNFGRITGSSLERRRKYLNRLKGQKFKG